MKSVLLQTLALSLIALTGFAQEIRTFSNAEGKTMKDTLVKFDYQGRLVTLKNKGNIPLDTFSEADQAYIQHWNQVQGFKSPMRFKIKIKENNWARMKHEQTVTPYFMDAIQIPGKKSPNHLVIIIDDYEEYNAVYMEAIGYTISLRNQNVFPIENIVVESKIYYEQEYYVTPDSFFVSSESEFFDTVTTNKVRFLSESIPIIIPREEVALHSECAVIVDHQIERNELITFDEEEGEEDGEEEMAEEEEEEGDEEEKEMDENGEIIETAEAIEGFGEWDDHGRRRKGKVTGVWFRIGIKNTNSEMIWREITSPTSLSGKMSWDPTPSEPEAEESPEEQLE